MFENRLSLLRDEKGLTKSEVAKSLGIPYTTYLNYENDIREPNSDTLIKIAKYYNVSIDYLLGVSDVRTTDIDVQEIRNATGLSEKSIVNIKKFCIGEPFGMVFLNKLLEGLVFPYDQEDKSILYEIIMYLFYNTPKSSVPDDYFALLANNTLKRISFKAEKTKYEIGRIPECELIQQYMLNRIIDALKSAIEK